MVDETPMHVADDPRGLSVYTSAGSKEVSVLWGCEGLDRGAGRYREGFNEL